MKPAVSLLLIFLIVGIVSIASFQIDNKEITPINEQRDVSISGTPEINMVGYKLEIFGEVEKPQSLTFQQAIAFPSLSKTVALYCVEGWSFNALWEGPIVYQIIVSSAPKKNAKYAVFYSADGFYTSLPLDYLSSRNIIIAHKINNQTLPVDRGYPFQLVAEDKYGYKWAKWITKIEITNESKLGYWETRGYSDEADVSIS